MLTELRDWLLSAGEGWSGEGVTPTPFVLWTLPPNGKQFGGSQAAGVFCPI